MGRIFEEFTQVDNPLQKRVRGTGLGLPLCKKLATLLGGDLSVESTPGQGSVFTLRLPQSVQVEREGGGRRLKRATRAKPTVLIVDDVEIDRYLLSHLITAGGDYDIIQAEDGQAGLEVAKRERPDVIFLDVNLPRMDGFAVATELQAEPSTRDIPVFAVTAEKLDETNFQRLNQLTRGVILKERLSEAQRVHIRLSAPAQITLE
jgi:CheY-like chemotaxis protein